MNRNKRFIKTVALLLFVLISLSSCTTDGDTRIPIERIDLSSSEFEGGLFAGVTNRVAPQSSSAALSDSHPVLADVSPPLRRYPAATAIYNETRIFEKNDVSFDFFYGIAYHYFPNKSSDGIGFHDSNNRTCDTIFDYVNIRIYVESGGVSRVIAVNDNFNSNREKYVIETECLCIPFLYLGSYAPFGHSETVTIPSDVFTERVGTVSVGIDFYGFKNADDDPAEAEKIEMPFRKTEQGLYKTLGYVNTGERIILFENPSDALNRYK